MFRCWTIEFGPLIARRFTKRQFTNSLRWKTVSTVDAATARAASVA
jgi:hypothetical protein